MALKSHLHNRYGFNSFAERCYFYFKLPVKGGKCQNTCLGIDALLESSHSIFFDKKLRSFGAKISSGIFEIVKF